MKGSGVEPSGAASGQLTAGRGLEGGHDDELLGPDGDRIVVAWSLGVPGAAVADDSNRVRWRWTRTPTASPARRDSPFSATPQARKGGRMDATEFCASLGRKMKEVSMTSEKASLGF